MQIEDAFGGSPGAREKKEIQSRPQHRRRLLEAAEGEPAAGLNRPSTRVESNHPRSRLDPQPTIAASGLVGPALVRASWGLRHALADLPRKIIFLHLSEEDTLTNS